MCVHSVLGAKRIARQYWRAWIETRSIGDGAGAARASPASIGGRGLKPPKNRQRLRGQRASPASIGGRGLKRFRVHGSIVCASHRPPVLAGVD